jgi:hypothetical protein
MSASASRPDTAVDEKNSISVADSQSRPQTATNDPAIAGLGGAAPMMDEKAQAQAAANAIGGPATNKKSKGWFRKRKADPESEGVKGMGMTQAEEPQKQVGFTELFR